MQVKCTGFIGSLLQFSAMCSVSVQFLFVMFVIYLGHLFATADDYGDTKPSLGHGCYLLATSLDPDQQAHLLPSDQNLNFLLLDLLGYFLTN